MTRVYMPGKIRSSVFGILAFGYIHFRCRLLRYWDGLLRLFRYGTYRHQANNGIIKVTTDTRLLDEQGVRILGSLSPSGIQHRQPITLDQQVFWKFRLPVCAAPMCDLLSLDGGRTCGSDGAVITSKGTLLRDYSGCYFCAPDSHPLMLRYFYPPVQDLEGMSLNLGFPKSTNYFHWLFDVLPRWGSVMNRLDLRQVHHYLVDHRFPFQRDSLEALGVPLAKCRQLQSDSHYRCETMIVPPLQRGISSGSVSFLRSRFLMKCATNEEKRTKRIYVSRRRCSRRKVLNEDAVYGLLSRYGFTSVDPESLGFEQQVALFHGADFVVGAHGGALANLVFCQPDCKVIEIFAPGYVNVCYWEIAGAVGLVYAYLLGEGYSPAEGKDPHLVYDDIFVDVQRLERLLRRMLQLA
jgi:hypothetical protein